MNPNLKNKPEKHQQPDKTAEKIHKDRKTHDKHGIKTPQRNWPKDQEHEKGPKI